MRHRTKRRLALLILLVGLPAYIFVASSVVTWLGRPSILVEFLVYLVLGFVWVLPFREIFRGVGQPPPPGDPDHHDE